MRQRLQAFAALGLTALCPGQAGLAASAAVDPVRVTVDFAASRSPSSMSGFLHGFDGTSPADKMIAPLAPALWRIAAKDDLTDYHRAASFGAQVQIIISDVYGYPINDWLGNGPPWENWSGWEARASAVANVYRDADVYYDIWNEPDVAEWNQTLFWNGTAQQFYETYERAYRVLREELGHKVLIGGPSYANYDEAALTAFLDYCKEKKIQVNVLSWHELFAGDDDTAAIADHVRTMTALKKKYKKQKIQKIVVNEIGGPVNQYNPAEILAYFYYLEEGGADGAAKGCWDNSKGENNCFNHSLDGILDAKGRPRAAWWTYKTYADGVASRVGATSDSDNIVALASADPAQVLIGSFSADAPAAATVELTLDNLAAAGVVGTQVTIKVYRIPATGEKTVKKLNAIHTQTVAAVGGSATVTLPDIKAHEEFLVQVSG